MRICWKASRSLTLSRWPSKRALSSLESNNGTKPIEITGPTKKLKSWESGAVLVQNTKIENEYTETIRAEVDPSLHLKTIEDELKGTIGKALGRQGQKVMMYRRAMEQERQRYVQLHEEHEPTDRIVLDSAKKHNGYRKDCVQARWELLVHRQAVGFIVGNHKYVMENFPIGEELPEDPEMLSALEDEDAVRRKEEKRKKFSDQLDWWQRIGRWR